MSTLLCSLHIIYHGELKTMQSQFLFQNNLQGNPKDLWLGWLLFCTTTTRGRRLLLISEPVKKSCFTLNLKLALRT